jgi:hypothetical protein
MKQIPIDAVLNYIPPSIRREEDNDLQLKSWMLQALRLVNPSQIYISKVVYLDIINHKTKLPEDLRKIEYVGICTKLPTKEVLDLCNNISEEESDEVIENNCKYPLTYRMFLDNYFSKDNYLEMSYIYNVDSDYLLCKDSINRHYNCKHNFTIDKDLNLTTTLTEGTIIVLYRAMIYDTIPNNEKLIRAMSKYAEAMHWENRMAVHEQGAIRIYEMKLLQADLAIRAAKGSTALRATSYDSVSNLVKNKIISYARVSTKWKS